MTDTIVLLQKAAVHLARALLGIWLLIGPFVLFLFRGESSALIVTLLLLAASYGFVVWRYRTYGVDYVSRFAFDTLTALGVALIAGVLSELLAFIGLRLHGNILIIPLLILACFGYLEYTQEKKRLTRHSAEAPGA
jgi:hypothetical protein